MKEEMEYKYRIVKNDLNNAMNCLDSAADILAQNFTFDNDNYEKDKIYDNFDRLSECDDYVNGRIWNAISNM